MPSPFDILKGPLEMQKLQLEIQKDQEPDQTIQGEIQSTATTKALLPYAKMATKQLMHDQANDPKFSEKFRRNLNQYQQHPESFASGVMQKFYGDTNLNDPTSQHIARYFAYNGQLYGQLLPALTAGTGIRGGEWSGQTLGPHVPDYSRLPQQNWMRLQTITPRANTKWAQLKSNPRTRAYTNQIAGATMQATQAWKQDWPKGEWDAYSPGLKQPAKALMSRASKNVVDAPPTAIGMYDKRTNKLLGYQDVISKKPYYLPAAPTAPMMPTSPAPLMNVKPPIAPTAPGLVPRIPANPADPMGRP